MSTPAPPRLMPHHEYKSWTTTWYDERRKRRTKRFGKQGDVSAKHARARFDRWMEQQWKRFHHVRSPDDAIPYTVAELAIDYAEHAKRTYINNGKVTTHIWQVAYAMDALSEHYGPLNAGVLDAPMLAKLRDAMVWGKDRKGNAKARALKTVNGRLFCIKQAFQWARERGMVPRETVADLMLVKPLAKGRSKAIDPVAVRAVDEATVRATMKHCHPTIAAMIELQWITGMRPGEACIMRPCDIEMREDDVWVYRPHTHKTEHKGFDRWVILGKQCIAILRPFMTRELAQYMFRPAEVIADRWAAKHAARKTPMNQGNKPGVRTKGTQTFAECYTDDTLRKAIHRAIVKANKAGAEIPKWNTNQLRHAYATRVRELYGVEEASIGLGHANLSTTEIYAERSMSKMIAVAKAIG